MMGEKDMELVIREVKEIENKDLQDCLFNLVSAIENEKESKKDIAKYIGKIVYEELYNDDFESVSKFAQYLNLSKSSLTQFKNYYEMTETGVATQLDLTMYYNELSYTQIIELYRLYKEIFYNNFGNEEDFVDALIVVKKLTTKEIRQYVDNTINHISEIESEYIENEVDTENDVDTENEVDAENEVKNEIEIYINYLKDLEEGMELDRADISIIKSIINILEKVA